MFDTLPDMDRPTEQGDEPPASEELMERLASAVEGVVHLLDQLDVVDDQREGGQQENATLVVQGVRARHRGIVSSRLGHAGDRLAVRAAGELASTRGYMHDASSTPARWMERHLGLRRGDAQRFVRVARLLDEMPGLAAPFATGDVRLAHLDSIARIVPARVRGEERAAMVNALAECEGELSSAAARSSVRQFERFCDRVRDRLDVDGPADRSAEPSQVWLSPGFGGRWNLSGDLSEDDGAMMAAFLEERTRRELLARCSSTDGVSQPDGSEPAVVMSEVRAAALLGLCRDGVGAKSAGRICLNLHMDLDDLRQAGGDSPRASTGSGTDISEETLWGLMADADVRPVFWGEAEPLSYGRSRRLAPEVLRRILGHRDRACCVPGCGAPPVWLDAHHVVRWKDGGVTDPANMVGPCRFHHRGHHQGRWRIESTGPGGDTAVYRPDGTLIDPEPEWSRYARSRNPYRRVVLDRLADARPPPVAVT